MNCLPERSDLDQSQPALMCYWTEAKQLCVCFFSCLSVTEHQGAGRGDYRVKGTQGPKDPRDPRDLPAHCRARSLMWSKAGQGIVP